MQLRGQERQRLLGIHRHRCVHTHPQQTHQLPGQRGGGELPQIHHRGGGGLGWQDPLGHQSLQEGGMQDGVQTQTALSPPGQQRCTGGGGNLLKSVTGAQAHVLATGERAHRRSLGGQRHRPGGGTGKGAMEIGMLSVPVVRARWRNARFSSGQEREQALHQGHGGEPIGDGVVEGDQQLTGVGAPQPAEAPERLTLTDEALPQIGHGDGLPGLIDRLPIRWTIPRPGVEHHRHRRRRGDEPAVIPLPPHRAAQQQMLSLHGCQGAAKGTGLKATAIPDDHREVHVARTAGIQQAFGPFEHIHRGAFARAANHA